MLELDWQIVCVIERISGINSTTQTPRESTVVCILARQAYNARDDAGDKER